MQNDPKTNCFLHCEWQFEGNLSVHEMNGYRVQISSNNLDFFETSDSSEEIGRFEG